MPDGDLKGLSTKDSFSFELLLIAFLHFQRALYTKEKGVHYNF